MEDKLKNLEDYADIFKMLDHAQKIVRSDSSDFEENQNLKLTRLERKVLNYTEED